MAETDIAFSAVHSSHTYFFHICVMMMILGLSSNSQVEKLYVDKMDLKLLVEDAFLLKLFQTVNFNTSLEVTAQIQHPDIVQFQTIQIPRSKEPNSIANISHNICVYAKNPGHSEVTFSIKPDGFVNVDSLYLRITVLYSDVIDIVSYIIGWIYCVVWSISFFPQIYNNFKRKSVVGLNFDFLALNMMGFTMYSLFNCGLYFSEEIQNEYFSRHPRGLNPVHINDVFFSLLAGSAALITITQCFFYKRDGQRVSTSGRGFLSVFISIVMSAAGLGVTGAIQWLDFLYYCSYVKLCITLIKYVPQAYMNYQRKSTVGWSIGNIFLDFVGGFLSVLQMVLNAYNFNDWTSFSGDLTKFGLGLFSLIFDVFFMMQHYVFYRNNELKNKCIV